MRATEHRGTDATKADPMSAPICVLMAILMTLITPVIQLS